MKELSGIWNCQITRASSLEYLEDARIVHYFLFKEALYPICSKETLMRIKSDGVVSEQCASQLKLSNRLFDKVSVSSDYFLVRKEVLDPCWGLYCDYPSFFRFLLRLSSSYKRVVTCLWNFKRSIRRGHEL